MSEINEIKTYICITLDINTQFIDVIDVCNTIEDGKNACVKHADSLVVDDDEIDEIRYTKWEPTNADTGICKRYAFYDKEGDLICSGILFVIEFIRDLTDVMNRLKDTKTLELDHKVPFAYSTQRFNYKVPDDLLKYVKPSDEIVDGVTLPIFNKNTFKWGEPYAIKFVMPDDFKLPPQLHYGIAASISNDCKTVTFLTTNNNFGDPAYSGRPREIKITIDQILSRNVDSITYCGITK